jgi:hypothetical protein
MINKLNDRPLRVRVHRRYRVIAEVARGRPVVEVADRAGHLSMAYEWIHRFNASGFTTFAQAPQSEGATEAEALASFHEQGLAPEAGRAIYMVCHEGHCERRHVHARRRRGIPRARDEARSLEGLRPSG